MARLVLEQQRRGRFEKVGGIPDTANVHARIVGTPRNYNPPRS
jgi:hypothetical protein